MTSIRDFQFVGFLRAAREQLAYSEYILGYLPRVGRWNYDPSAKIDQFYMRIHNICFCDALLIVGTLLDGDKRVISFKNWPEFMTEKRSAIEVLTNRFKSDGLKTIRDQVVAHADLANKNNQFPHDRQQGMIYEHLVQKLLAILKELIAEFNDFTKRHGNPYHPSVFEPADAKIQISTIMDLAKPELTDNWVF